MTNWEKNILKAKTAYKQPEILSFCAGRHVLDVGCVGQDLDPSRENWLHAKLQKTASTLIGCDINDEGIQNLNELGFHIIRPEALEQMSRKYDVIVMGDVIEHVNDPGSFLEFYSQFLAPSGKIIVCTPNAFGIRYFLQVLFYGKPGSNPEHTLFLDPLVMLEMIRRINLKPVRFRWLHEYQRPANFKQRVIYFLSGIFVGFRRYFRPNFLMVLEKENQ